jgi:hypothetical protein
MLFLIQTDIGAAFRTSVSAGLYTEANCLPLVLSAPTRYGVTAQVLASAYGDISQFAGNS